MVHSGNTLLSMFVGGHFGANGIRVAEGETWDKVFGPVFCTHPLGGGRPQNVAALWADAKKQAAVQMGERPYALAERDDCPPALAVR